MGKNVIVSEQTLQDLLEAYASLSAWYYQLWGALRAAGHTTNPPDDAARIAFLQRFAQDYPELAAVAKTIPQPRMYVPPPAQVAAPPPPMVGSPPPISPDAHQDAPTTIEPANARLKEMVGGQSLGGGPPPPPMVPPGKYGSG